MGEIASLGSAFFWAAASLLFAGLGQSIRPSALNLLKCVIALALMFLTQALLTGSIPRPDLTQFTLLSVSGIVGLTIGDTAYFAALTRLGPRKSLLFAALTPFVTATLGAVFLGESITLTMLAGMLLTVGGVLWVVLDGAKAKRSTAFAAGAAFALVSVASQAGGSILTKMGTGELASLEVSIFRLLAGSLGLVVVVAARAQWADVKHALTDRAIFTRLFIALFFGTYLGIWLMNAGLKYTYAGIAATLTSTSPIWILPLAHIFTDDKMTARSVTGAIIAVLGIALLFYGRPL